MPRHVHVVLPVARDAWRRRSVERRTCRGEADRLELPRPTPVARAAAEHLGATPPLLQPGRHEHVRLQGAQVGPEGPAARGAHLHIHRHPRRHPLLRRHWPKRLSLQPNRLPATPQRRQAQPPWSWIRKRKALAKVNRTRFLLPSPKKWLPQPRRQRVHQ